MFSFSIVQRIDGCYGVTNEEVFVMVVHRKSLLELVPFGLLEDPNAVPTFLSWNSWGPPVTRWFRDNPVCESLTFTYGQRLAVQPLPATDEDNKDTITIYDFNPWHVREVRLYKESILAGHDSCSDDFRIDIFDGEAPGNICPARNIFKFDIIGRLPYIRYSSSSWPDYDAVMIDEERLIGIQASSLPIQWPYFRLKFGTRWTKKHMA